MLSSKKANPETFQKLICYEPSLETIFVVYLQVIDFKASLILARPTSKSHIYLWEFYPSYRVP